MITPLLFGWSVSATNIQWAKQKILRAKKDAISWLEIHLEELQLDDDSLDNEWLCNKKQGKGILYNKLMSLFPLNSCQKGFHFPSRCY